MSAPTLHMICGKIAAGKSTLAASLEQHRRTVRLSEDSWLATLYSDQMESFQDYLRVSSKLQTIMTPHVTELLQAGLSVVLDFPANTRNQRAWMREVIDRSGADHQMHLLLTPDAVCLDRLRARNADGTHPFAATEAQFEQMSRHFSPPTEAEGFTLIHHDYHG